MKAYPDGINQGVIGSRNTRFPAPGTVQEIRSTVQEPGMPLTPRERVLAAIHHEEPDRVPLVIGVSNATGIKMKTYQQLKRLIGVEGEDRYLYDWPELGTAAPEEKVLVRLSSDARGILDRHPQDTIDRNRARQPGEPFIDSWGLGQVEVSPGEWFPGVHPLAEARTLEDLESYPGWPDPEDRTRVAQVRSRAMELAAAGEYAILATPWLLFPLERAFGLQRMDRFLMNMATNREFAEALLRKNAALCKDLMLPFLQELGDNVDMVKIGDDLGTQTSLLMSPSMYREILKPIHADYIAFIKSHTKARIFFHTDGDVFPLLEDFIEIGVDILNPIQTSAGKMSDLTTLKRKFGDRLVFCGGIDTHHVLPKGSPADVRAEVRRVIRELAPGGGFMAAAVHTIMNDVPPENVLAMVDAIEEFGRYPIR
jgi:uroporphyrinogen decarboxylase